MSWIRFGPYEQAAPALSGDLDLRGRVCQLVFFEHGPGCPHCTRLVGRLAAGREVWAELGAEVVVVSATARGPEHGYQGRFLDDSGGQLRARYARLLEFDTSGCLFLFVLDRHGAPFAAWVGPEAPEEDLTAAAANWLAFAERQCPE